LYVEKWVLDQQQETDEEVGMDTAVRLASIACGLLLWSAPLAAQHGGLEHASPHPQTARPLELERELEALREATERYRDHAVAVAEGFKLFGGEAPLMGEHWYHPERVEAELDLAKPSTLQYARIGGRRQLVGVAYTVYRRPEDPIPAGFAGDEDRWHVHDVVKLAQVLAAGRPAVRFLVDLGVRRGRIGAGDGRTHLTMVHAWPWLENPDGDFAQKHRALPYVRAGLPATYAASGDEDAAWGVSLLTVGTCRSEVQRVGFLARLSQDQRSRLSAACADAESRVRTAASPGVAAATLNAAASEAWGRYREVLSSILTTDQKARLAATVEHEHAMGGG
jgi:hypothetical protein